MMLSVANTAWLDGHRFDPAVLPSLPAAEAGRVVGQFATAATLADGSTVLCRDVLGVNKLFYALDGDEVRASNSWHELRQAGHPDVWSVPAGHEVRLRPGGAGEIRRIGGLMFGREGDAAGPVVDAIRTALDTTVSSVAQAIGDRPAYVALSGGLDSTVIAVLARACLPRLTAVTFGVIGPEGDPEDLTAGARVAGELGLPFLPVRVTPDELLEWLDVALVAGQDWRDFNVHCALVNAAIGAGIRRHAAGAGARPVVLTGDVMNELVCDYEPVHLHGREYYTLPRLPRAPLRRVLVEGLDAGDREIGVFHHFGIDTFQPYGLAARAYAALPPDLLGYTNAKQHVVRQVMGDRVPAFVYARPKTRAQEGGPGGLHGALGVCAANGLDAAWLRQRFATLYGLSASEMDDAIRGGRYRIAQDLKRRA